MPLIYLKQVNVDTKVGVWHIEEREDFFTAGAANARAIPHPQKRLQHLAGRHLLHELFPEFPMADLRVNDLGKPFLPAALSCNFSLSHCRNLAAAIVSRSMQCGIDVEAVQEKISRVSHKFFGKSERAILGAILSEPVQAGTLCWSIKEAAFKWYEKGGVNFLEDMQIESADLRAGVYSTELFFGKEVQARITVQSVSLRENFLSWVLR